MNLLTLSLLLVLITITGCAPMSYENQVALGSVLSNLGNATGDYYNQKAYASHYQSEKTVSCYSLPDYTGGYLTQCR